MYRRELIDKAICLFVLVVMIGLAGRSQGMETNVDESKVPAYTLPDVLQMQTGRKVKSAEEWTKIQRPYIYRLYEENQFGRFPSIKLPLMYRILELNKHAINGLATRKQVRLYLHPQDTTVFTDVLIYLPNKIKKPVPVFVGYNFSGNQSIQEDKEILLAHTWLPSRNKGVINNKATGSSRGVEAAEWPVKEIIAHGYAVATAYYGDMEPDTAIGWETGIRTTLSKQLNIQLDEWSAIGAWAYGLTRIADYLEKDKDFDANRIAVIGHSRLGKSALWAGASDQRFHLVVSNESGEGGAALSKRWYGENVKVITTRFPYWFVEKFKTYGDNTNALPIDAHMLLSLIAPRLLYVASAEGDSWSDPKGEFLAAKEASRVYELFGKQGINRLDSMPALQQPIGNTVRYHIRSGKHDITLYDWQQYLHFADMQWKSSQKIINKN
jgi:hypothetical protein